MAARTEPTHEQVVAYYRKLGTLVEPDENETQAALDAANAESRQYAHMLEPKGKRERTEAKGRKARQGEAGDSSEK